MARVFSACLLVLLFGLNPGLASENTIRGFAVSTDVLENFVGSGHLSQIDQIVAANDIWIEDVQRRFEAWSDNEHGAPSVRAVLEEMVTGRVVESHAFEYQCVTELILRTLGTELEDQTPNRSLWNYLDLWLDAPDTMLEALDYETLGGLWLRNTNPLKLPGNAEWPTITHVTKEQIARALDEARKVTPKRINKLKPDLFEGRGDELSVRQLKRANVEVLSELLRWLRQTQERNDDGGNGEYALVLVVDGDQ